MMPPSVSVLMTAFNRERYIAAAIESVLAQTYTDFELVIVDDRSTDGTLALARSYEAQDARVRVVANERNLGDYPNRNRAAALARGRYLKYHDSDDIMYPHCLETMVSSLERYPEAGFALSASRYWHGGPSPMLSTPRLSYQREFLGYGMFMCGPSCALFRTSVFEALGGFAEKGPHSDLAFWLRACRTVPVLLTSADLFWYRVHDGQHLQSGASLWDRAAIAREIWTALEHPECPLTGGELDRARRNTLYGVARDAWRAFRRGQLGLSAFTVTAVGASPSEWMQYLRRPHRDAAAGTPTDDWGGYVLSREPERSLPGAVRR